MKIAIRRGHQKTGADGCASGIVNEITVAEDYKNRLITKFKSLGHQVLDCTPPEANRSLSNSLWFGINKANNWGADVFISCHVNNAYNSYNGKIGCEVLYHRNSSTGKKYAISIESQLSSLGFKSRGAKADVRGLAEINNTNMPCVIIEPFFVEATGDISTYKKVGGEGIANAIIKGVTGKTISSKVSKPKEIKPKRPPKRIIVYDNGIDKNSAEYLADFLDCPTIENKRPFYYDVYDEVYAVGGSKEGRTGYLKYLISGSDRYNTFEKVIDYILNHKK